MKHGFKQMRSQCLEHCYRMMQRHRARTYGRTNGEVLTFGENSYVSYRARGVARFILESVSVLMVFGVLRWLAAAAVRVFWRWVYERP